MKTGAISIILGICSILYFIAMFIFGGKIISFSEFWIILGVLLIILGTDRCSGKKTICNKFSKNVKKILKISIAIILMFFISVEGLLIYSGTIYDKAKSDYLVVLGAGLKGERMSQALYARMIKSLEYIKENPDTMIVVSGGQGPGEYISEAEAMERFLVRNDIDKEKIIKEDKSRSTYENLKFTKEKLQKLNGNKKVSITIITNNFHVYRAKMLAKRQGFKAYGMPASLHPLITPNYYVREFLAIIKSYFFDR
ncbi:YdcF family protein [Clostridium aestuarii]|uniref:YdcF family protein n=1 Tax=Clostridium aestuarii TaxID=338193 RepID=A0ABT4CV41_9CLOT|nr:YdcF family protein [Clostridium aestuarii]MCY6482852.1 YdcF family protein [Clostridium aestuarii]